MKDTIALVATIGTLVGGIGGAAVGCAPVAIAAAVQYFTTINEPVTPAPAK